MKATCADITYGGVDGARGDDFTPLRSRSDKNAVQVSPCGTAYGLIDSVVGRLQRLFPEQQFHVSTFSV